MDVPLSDFGRKQAFLLSQALTVEACGKIHCSDLKRSIDTTFYAMAFPDIQEIN
jgi:broad specificity phosphatase PhoE